MKNRLLACISFVGALVAINLSAKDSSWGQVNVISSDESHLEFEWVLDWPNTLSSGVPSLNPESLELPGSTLTPENRSVVPLTIGALFKVPEVNGVRLEVLEIKSSQRLEVSGRDIDSIFRSKKYSELEFGQSEFGFNVSEAHGEFANAADESGLPSFVEISSLAWLREHRVIQLRCHPIRLDRDGLRLERLERIRGRLVFSDPLEDRVVLERANRLRSPVFDRVVNNQVVNPSENRVAISNDRGIRKLGHEDGGQSSPLLKIGFDETGIYQLSAPVLASQGVDLETIDSSTFRLFDGESERPLLVFDGGDSRLDGSDSILFYGESIESIYATSNSYILRWGGEAGRRMSERMGGVGETALFAEEFVETLHFEEDLHYWQNMENGEGQDHWFWQSQLNGPDQREYEVSVLGVAVASATPVRVRVNLKGLSSIPEVLPDHHTRIYLNDRLISDERWDGNALFEQVSELGVKELLEGKNRVRVEVVGDLPVVLDQIFVDWIEIDYPRRLAARNGRLIFSGADHRLDAVSISGFRNDAVHIFDVSDPLDVTRILGASVSLKAQGFNASFNGGGAAEGEYVAVDNLGFLAPPSLQLVDGSDWGDPDHQADYLIVSYRPFIEALEPLIERKRSQGLSVSVVPVDEVYNEFGSGVVTPDAIIKFVQQAYNEWRSPAPVYLLLVGDSSLDPRDIFDTGTQNYLPSEITEMNFFGESVSDDGFVRVDGDDFLPDMLVGRLPAQSIEDLEVMVDKTLSYESEMTDLEWNKRVLVVADDDSEVFEELSESLVGLLPNGFEADSVYLSQSRGGTATREIFQKINEGRVMVNYTGHGSRSTWGIGDIGGIMFENADAAALSNQDALSVVTVANCLNGFFVARAAKPCLAEIFLRNSGGGAVAVWAPTSLGFPSGHRLLVRNLYETVFVQDELELGAAILVAKLSTLTNADFFKDQVKSYTYFGDPSLQLALPNRLAPVNLTIVSLGADGIEIRFNPVDGRRYTIESTDTLGGGARWLALPGGGHDSGRVTVSANSDSKFFRVRTSLTGEGLVDANE